ncbi:MAG: hypothetical protein AAGC69_10575 [Paracraurococcus sp.]|jgi:hypothetical protein
MQPAFDRTDWSVLSTLLRMAQRDGWRVEFATDRILVSSRRAQEGVIRLPANLMRHARSCGWQAAIRTGEISLRHPSVRQGVTLRLRTGEQRDLHP